MGNQPSGSTSSPSLQTSPTPPGSSGNSAPAVLWEWSNDSNGWTAYDAETCDILETAYASGSTQVDLTHSFFGKQGGYTIDFKAMSQLKKSTGYTRNVRRAVQVPTGPATTKKRRATTSPPPSTNVTWEWENDSNGFTAYDTATSDIIETAYIADPTQTIELTHSFFGKQGGYTIDLQAMTQTKKATGYVRQLRRVDPSGTTTGGLKPATKKPKTPVASPPPVTNPITNTPPPAVANTSPPTTTGASPPTPTPGASGGPVWEYQDGSNWAVFDRITTRMIEGAVSQGRSVTTLNHGTWAQKGGCVVDFSKLEMKENKSGNVIQLRRNPPLANKPKASPIVLDDDDDSASSNKKNSGSTFADPGKAKYQAAAKLTGWKEIKKKAVPEKESCPICLLELADSNDVVQLSKCQGHMFHKDCIIHCYQQDFLKCPICSTVYGTLVGTQPKGTMTVTKSSSKLPGYKCGTITVNYYFPNGTQGPEHPNPGQAYEGTSRTGYFPDNDEGNKVVNLLKIAWDRRLIFRIGTSVTTGQENCVVWNGIHHKTSTSGGPSNYGYPDDTYLERVKDELAVKGVE